MTTQSIHHRNGIGNENDAIATAATSAVADTS